MKNIKQKAFSLIEVLISISIVSLVSIVVLTLFSIGNGSVISSNNRSEELFRLQSQIEKEELGAPNNQRFPLLIAGKEYFINLDVHQISGETGVEIIYFKYNSNVDE